jgi:hypothetical protein
VKFVSKELIDFALVRERVPLKSFVRSLGVDLEPDGDGWRAPCPLHQEKRGASFRIDPDEEHWVCFGKCNSGGDIIDFAKIHWGCATAAALEKLLDGEIPLRDPSSRQPESDGLKGRYRKRKWPARDLELIRAIVAEGPGLYDLWESSPVRFDGDGCKTEEIVDILFPGDPLLCCGRTAYDFNTHRRSEWRGQLSSLPLIVPSPMLAYEGLTTKGTPSEHSKQATAQRVYLAIEFDFSIYETDGQTETEFAPLIRNWSDQGITVADACAALHWHMAAIPSAPPLVMAVHSGGKSLHAWFRAFPLYDEVTWPFMSYAYQLGADHVTWTRSQFVRIPDGRRENGKTQTCYYLDPGKAVKE